MKPSPRLASRSTGSLCGLDQPAAPRRAAARGRWSSRYWPSPGPRSTGSPTPWSSARTPSRPAPCAVSATGSASCSPGHGGRRGGPGGPGRRTPRHGTPRSGQLLRPRGAGRHDHVLDGRRLQTLNGALRCGRSRHRAPSCAATSAQPSPSTPHTPRPRRYTRPPGHDWPPSRPPVKTYSPNCWPQPIMTRFNFEVIASPAREGLLVAATCSACRKRRRGCRRSWRGWARSCQRGLVLFL